MLVFEQTTGKILSKSITVRPDAPLAEQDRGKTRGRREYMCIPHYREIPEGTFVPGLRGVCMGRMEDGFREALLNMSMFRRDWYRIGSF